MGTVGRVGVLSPCLPLLLITERRIVDGDPVGGNRCGSYTLPLHYVGLCSCSTIGSPAPPSYVTPVGSSCS